MKLPTISINTDILKIIALVTMTIDHIATFLDFIPYSDVGRYIGRTSFPIFAFLLMKHLSQKQIYKKYIIRLSIFGVITMLVLLPFYGEVKVNPIFPFNIMFTFLIAVLALFVYNKVKNGQFSHSWKQRCLRFSFFCFGLMAFISQYSVEGFCYLITIYFYYLKPSKLKYLLILVFSILFNVIDFGWIVSFVTTFILLQLDSNKQYPRIIKHWWSWYVYYPLHLFILLMLSSIYG